MRVPVVFASLLLLGGCVPQGQQHPVVTEAMAEYDRRVAAMRAGQAVEQAPVAQAPASFTPVAAQVPSPAAPSPPVNGFDPSISSLPRRFNGDDIARVRAALAAMNPQKGEFETTADYRVRLERLLAREIVPGRRVDSIFAFSAPYRPRGTYNADRGAFPMAFSSGSFSSTDFGSLFGTGGSRDGLVTIRTLESREDTYRGQNAFGASATIFRTRARALAVQACGSPLFDRNRTYEPFECPRSFGQTEIRVPPAQAAAVRDRMRLLIVGPLRAPYIGQDTTYGGRVTVSNPFDTQISYETVVMRVREVIIYDHESGDILHRIRF